MIDTLKIYIEYSIIGVLVFMSFLTLWFAFERIFFLPGDTSRFMLIEDLILLFVPKIFQIYKIL